LQNKKINYGQATMGDNTFRELDSAGNVIASLAATGKFTLTQAHADAAGNWYVLGTFYDTISLDPSHTLARDPMGTSNNYFLFRLHAGTLAPDWLQLIGSNYYSSASCFTIANDKLYAPIDSYSSTHIYQYNLTTGIPTKLWSQTGRSYTQYIQADSAGNVYLMGDCVGNGGIDFNGVAPPVPPSNKYPWYIARYHADGQYNWHHYITDITCNSRSFMLNGNNALYLSGTLSDSATLGSYYFTKPTSLFNADYLFARLDSNGSLIWARQRPISGTVQSNIYFNTQFHSAAADTSVYLFQETQGVSMWDTGVSTSTNNRRQATLVSYNAANGKAEWAKTITGLTTSAQHIITDGTSLWITGNGTDSNKLAFDTVTIPTVQGSYIPYIAKMQVVAGKTIVSPPTAITTPQEESIKVWPNPAAGYIVLDGLTGKETITIRDITGRATLQPTNSGNTHQRITTSALPRGVYFLEITTSHSRMLIRLILE
jgi:hypothetical protein